MVQAIFWDNDGILVETEILFFRATQEILRQEGISLILEYFQEQCLRKGKSSFDLVEEKGFSKDYLLDLKAQRDKIFRNLMKITDISIPGVQETLAQLWGKFTMGIVASTQKIHLKANHESTGFLKYFEFVSTQEDVKRAKPDPKPYLLALQKTNFQRNNCVVIEDSERGMTAAKAAGIRYIVIPNELSKTGNFQ